MGRNYRCWIVGGLRARAPVKCLCFPPCLPSKDLHILTHYGVLWSWSAWLPQPAITLIASKKLKSFKALWPHSWGKNVCLFLSISLPFSLPLSFCSCSSMSACRLSIYNACLQQSQKEACKAEALVRVTGAGIFSAMSKPLDACSFTAAHTCFSLCNPKKRGENWLCFCFCLACCNVSPSHARRILSVWLPFINCFTGVPERQCSAQKFSGGRICARACVT